MNELSLFTGAGGGVLGSILLGHRIVGYVEIDEYCQKIIAQRIKDGILDEAPIFSNIQAFNRAGFAEQYQGLVDVITGGFPCQDISCAGKGAGITGKRSGLWFEMETTIRLVRPRYVFIENSPMLLVRGFDTIVCALSEMGYDVAWGIVSAADVGAPHIRKRLWILAHTDSCMRERRPNVKGGQAQKRNVVIGLCKDVADTEVKPERTDKQRITQPSIGTIQGENERYNGWWESEPGLG